MSERKGSWTAVARMTGWPPGSIDYRDILVIARARPLTTDERQRLRAMLATRR